MGCYAPADCNIQTELVEEKYLKQGRINEYVGITFVRDLAKFMNWNIWR
jgi:hypothetical protein